ncbi:stage II sporulation protein M, partial [Candidatus Woesearchaeota archaeon]|nr:stage II sporulation protein M [Candidatus Woesearchaeota archaeon]
QLFRTQRAPIFGLRGQASVVSQAAAYVRNNIIVFLACFLLSVFYGAGSIIFLTWNASVWGAFFGFTAKLSSVGAHSSPSIILVNFFRVIGPIMPHMVLEALSYISAAIAGGVLSKAVLREKPFSKMFNHVLTDSLILLGLGIIAVFIAAVIEAAVF